MNEYPKISIIIPLYDIRDRFFSDLLKFDKLDYPNFEIIVVCDRRVQLPKLKRAKLSLLLTRKKRTGPAEKRDTVIKVAKGEICAFIDDDAYPDKNWLKRAVVHFQHPHIAAVGGPGLTPKEDGYWEQLTGLVYSSFFCGGFAQYRFIKGKMQFVDDYPAYNLLVRKDVLKRVGGYGSHFYGGEDTFLCLKIKKSGYKMLYDPETVVFHHRRPLFFAYLKQIANIGKHRGYFAKRFPETSRTFTYFLPSFLSLGLFLGAALSLIFSTVRLLYFLGVLFFILLGFLSVLKRSGVLRGLIAAIAIISTHVVYGVNFIRGILIRNLER